MKKYFLRTAFVLLALGALSFAQSPLQFIPNSLTFEGLAGSTTPLTATVRIQATSATSFTLISNQGWLDVNPKNANLSTGQSIDLTITANPSGIQTGTYSAILSAIPPGGVQPALLNITFTITGLTFFTEPAAMELTTYPEGIDRVSIRVTASDGLPRELSWTVSTKNGGNWLKFFPEFTPPVVTPVTGIVQGDATNLMGGVYEGEIQLFSASFPGLVKRVPVTFRVREDAPRMRVVPTNFNFYIFGTASVPAQPLQPFSNVDWPIYYDIAADAPGNISLLSGVEGITPGAIKLSVDAASAIQLPREESYTVTPRDGSTPVKIRVKVDLEPRRRRSVPQIADGGGFKTRISVVNADSAPARVSLRMFRVDPATRSTVPWNLQFEGTPALENVLIPVGSSWSVITTGTSQQIFSGWGEIISDQKVGGNAVFQFRQSDGRLQEAAVPINEKLMQRLLLPYDNRSGFVTSFALINLSSSEPAQVRVSFRDDFGKLLKSDRMPDIPAGGHLAIELPNLFPYLNGLKGTMDLSAHTGQIALLGLRFNPTGAFTSFEPLTFNRRETGRRSLAQIADGGLPAAGQFRTSITLTNMDFLPAYVTMKFYRSQAGRATAPWNLAFEGGMTSDSTIVIPVGSSITLRTTAQTSTVEQGWGEIITPYWVNGFAVFEQKVTGRPDQEAAVPLNHAAPRRLLLPFDNVQGFTTSVALANLSENETCEINLVFRDAAGNRLATRNVVLPTRGHWAFRLVDEFSVLEGKSGSLEISALSGEPSAVGLRFSPTGAYTTFKAETVSQF